MLLQCQPWGQQLLLSRWRRLLLLLLLLLLHLLPWAGCCRQWQPCGIAALGAQGVDVARRCGRRHPLLLLLLLLLLLPPPHRWRCRWPLLRQDGSRGGGGGSWLQRVPDSQR